MMAVFPFDPTGVQDKQDELYLLSDNALIVEVNAIESDFILWMNTHFSLTQGQITYLGQLGALDVFNFSRLLSFHIRNRLPIELNSLSGKPGKWIKEEAEIRYVFKPQGLSEVDSKLMISEIDNP